MKVLASFTEEYWKDFLKAAHEVNLAEMQKMAEIMWQVYLDGGTIYFMGNGGSASIASHLAADIGKNTVKDRNNHQEKRFNTLALTDNIAWMTALANDEGYENVFVEQLKNKNPNEKDLVVMISSSGNSPNVVKAAEWAKAQGIKTAAMVGYSGGKLKDIVDVAVWIPRNHYGYVEGLHEDVHHYLVYALVELKKGEK
jgi:D-sedoheptulose 7-phosphate isomerase